MLNSVSIAAPRLVPDMVLTWQNLGRTNGDLLTQSRAGLHVLFVTETAIRPEMFLTLCMSVSVSTKKASEQRRERLGSRCPPPYLSLLRLLLSASPREERERDQGRWTLFDPDFLKRRDGSDPQGFARSGGHYASRLGHRSAERPGSGPCSRSRSYQRR